MRCIRSSVGGTIGKPSVTPLAKKNSNGSSSSAAWRRLERKTASAMTALLQCAPQCDILAAELSMSQRSAIDRQPTFPIRYGTISFSIIKEGENEQMKAAVLYEA